MGPRGVAPARTLPRRPGSIRRTTSHDCTRPDGLAGPVMARCAGRDVLTRSDGSLSTIDESRIEARVTFGDGTIAAVDTEPAIEGLDQLVGSSAYGGFRRRAGAIAATEKEAHTVGFQLLDDLPIALMLSGRVLRIAGITLGRPDRRPPVDLCAGWVDGGTLVQGFTPLGPPLHDGPVAGAVGRDDDPLAWHDLPAPSPLSTRRVRRLDVWTDDGIGKVDSWFRDSYVNDDGLETVVHEYAVAADVDLRAHEVVATTAVPATLPAPECPNAVASAARLVGDPVEGLRDRVPSTLTGPSTCTHLNDALRALEDAGALLDALGASTPAGGQHDDDRQSKEERP